MQKKSPDALQTLWHSLSGFAASADSKPQPKQLVKSNQQESSPHLKRKNPYFHISFLRGILSG